MIKIISFIGAGTIFRLVEQKLVKNKTIRFKIIILCNVYFSKKSVYIAVYNGVWDKGQKMGNFQEFFCQK